MTQPQTRVIPRRPSVPRTANAVDGQSTVSNTTPSKAVQSNAPVRDTTKRTDDSRGNRDPNFVPKPYIASYVNVKRAADLKERGFLWVDLNNRTVDDIRDDKSDQPVRFHRRNNGKDIAEGATLISIDELITFVAGAKSKYVHPNKGNGKEDAKATAKPKPKPKDNFKDPRGDRSAVLARDKPAVEPKYKDEVDMTSPFYAALKDFKVAK